MWLQGLFIRTLFLGTKCWILPRHIHPMGNLGPRGTRMLAEVLSWMLFFNTNKNGAEPSKFLNFFIYTPLFKWDDIRWYFPGLCGSQRPLCGTLVRLPWSLSLMFPYSRTMMIVLRRPLHSVVSDRNGLGIFVPLPPAVLMGFTNEANIELEAGLVKFSFSVLCSSCFIHGNKAPWFLSTFYKADVTSRALSSHFVSCF